MKAVLNIKNLHCDEGKRVILRNLSRIMDVRVIDIDVATGILHFLYINPVALIKVKQELSRLGYPIHKRSIETYPPNMFGSEGISSLTLQEA
ncbi:hypothetical protein HPE56_11600 [Maribacter sp. ANRC-HE7]|uniref:HMA domain-containing protein n=1 Tax=Maribacter aquimaris TaxID=2737171 RepID=A0ABR7V0T1_9FLAO|nr:hypothetical protein [Maribacter aquimaris]MBD0778440.1 hypothetical protein [Maribacter aquimaris]